MKRSTTLGAVATGVLLFGLISSTQASPITVQWGNNSCSDNATFIFDLEVVPGQNAYTLDGKAESQPSGYVYPARGGAVLNPVTGDYQVSIYYTSATGETFTYGASLNTTSLSGSGTVQRIAHGSVGSDCNGTLSVVE